MLLTLLDKLLQCIDVVFASFEPGIIMCATLYHEDLFEGSEDGCVMKSLCMRGRDDFVLGTADEKHRHFHVRNSIY